MRTGYALRPVSLYNTVHTDSFTAILIITVTVIVIVIIIVIVIVIIIIIITIINNNNNLVTSRVLCTFTDQQLFTTSNTTI